MQVDEMLNRYYSVVPGLAKAGSRKSLQWECGFLFGDVDVSGYGFLDIGGGIGLGSFYAACAGATEVVCLEPEAEGSTHGVRKEFASIAEALGVENARIVDSTFQAFEAEPGTFGVVFLNASVNHLDEPACIDILKSEEARNTYIGLFRRMAELTRDDGAIIISDVSRHNVFPALGLKHPTMRTIEWHKHQSPRTWARLLRAAGYGDIKITWHTRRRLGGFGRALLGNSAGAFMTRSRFRIRATVTPRGD
jgi:hypothetical protein